MRGLIMGLTRMSNDKFAGGASGKLEDRAVRIREHGDPSTPPSYCACRKLRILNMDAKLLTILWRAWNILDACTCLGRRS
jgi:hypothetical protein